MTLSNTVNLRRSKRFAESRIHQLHQLASLCDFFLVVRVFALLAFKRPFGTYYSASRYNIDGTVDRRRRVETQRGGCGKLMIPINLRLQLTEKNEQLFELPILELLYLPIRAGCQRRCEYLTILTRRLDGVHKNQPEFLLFFGHLLWAVSRVIPQGDILREDVRDSKGFSGKPTFIEWDPMLAHYI